MIFKLKNGKKELNWDRLWTLFAVLLLLFFLLRYAEMRYVAATSSVEKAVVVRTVKGVGNHSSCMFELRVRRKLHTMSYGDGDCSSAEGLTFVEVYYSPITDSIFVPGELELYVIYIALAFVHVLATFLPWQKIKRKIG